MEKAYQDAKETVDEAQQLLVRAIELDPEYATAYAMAAYCYALRKASRWTTEHICALTEAKRLARKAVQLGKDDAVALARAGHTLAYVLQEFGSAAFFINRALGLNQNLASA